MSSTDVSGRLQDLYSEAGLDPGDWPRLLDWGSSRVLTGALQWVFDPGSGVQRSRALEQFVAMARICLENEEHFRAISTHHLRPLLGLLAPLAERQAFHVARLALADIARTHTISSEILLSLETVTRRVDEHGGECWARSCRVWSELFLGPRLVEYSRDVSLFALPWEGADAP